MNTGNEAEADRPAERAIYDGRMTTPTEERPPPNPELVLANWHHELDAAELYNYLAAREADAERKSILIEMAESEVRHAKVMERGLEKLGVALPAHRTGTQTRAMKTLARMFGNKIVYPLLHGMEISGTAEYSAQDEATAALAPDERSHARVLGTLAEEGAVSERWHRSGGGGTLRAAVFGISDGLLSNLSLIMGFAGAAVESNVILLAGLAGLLAGASSMAAGEYVSMRAQRELFERQIRAGGGGAGGDAGRGAGGADDDLPRQRRAGGRSSKAGRAPGSGPQRGAGHAGARGIGARPRRAGLALGGGHRIIPGVRGRRLHPDGPVLLRREHGPDRAERGPRWRGDIQRGRIVVGVHGAELRRERLAAAGDWCGRGDADIRSGKLIGVSTGI